MLDAETFAAIHLLYGRQSHSIDSGRAREWAATFTADGVFDSPSYPQPEVGTEALTVFAERFYIAALLANEKRRHVITNVAIGFSGPTEVTVECYLQIMATPRGGETRIVRFTTVHDRFVLVDGRWRIHHRAIARDDS